MKNTCIFLLLALIGFFAPQKVTAQKKGAPLFQAPLGIASYTFRDQWKNGVPETLDIIQKMGFKSYEGGAPEGVDPVEFKKMLADRGISIPSTGTGFEELESDPQGVADRAKALGASYVMCAWIPHARGQFSKADADRAIKVFNVRRRT